MNESSYLKARTEATQPVYLVVTFNGGMILGWTNDQSWTSLDMVTNNATLDDRDFVYELSNSGAFVNPARLIGCETLNDCLMALGAGYLGTIESLRSQK